MNESVTISPVSVGTHKWAFPGFAGVLVVTLGLHCVTISHSPAIWKDEVQILDYARVLFNPSTDWSLTMDRRARAGLLPNPVYLAVLHGWTKVFGLSPAATRSLACVSASAAVVLFWALMRSVAIGPWMCTVAGLGLWFDGLFIKSFRGARADPFAMAVALGACLAWNLALRRNSSRWAAVAGMLAPISLLSWPTAAVVLLLAPGLWGRFAVCERDLRLRLCLIAATSGAAVVAIYALAYWLPNRERIAATLLDTYSLGRIPVLRACRGTFSFAPWVFLALAAATILAVWRRSAAVPAAALVLGLLIVAAGPQTHEYRLVYLLPSMYFFIAQAFPEKMGWILLVALLTAAPSGTVHCGMRVLAGVQNYEMRDYAPIAARLRQLIPEGAQVVTGPGCDSEHYYTGRANAWRMYDINADIAVRNVPVFYLLVEHNRGLPDWIGDYSCDLLAQLSTPPIREWITGREYSLYDVRVYRCRRAPAPN